MEKQTDFKMKCFIKQRILDDGFNDPDFPLESWDNAKVFSFEEMAQKFFNININLRTPQNYFWGDKIIGTFIYDPDFHFEYFSSVEIVHDGTFIHREKAMRELVEKVCRASTYDNQKAPKDYLEHRENYIFKMICGDIILNSKYGNYEINGNKIHGVHELMAVPLFWECQKTT